MVLLCRSTVIHVLSCLICIVTAMRNISDSHRQERKMRMPLFTSPNTVSNIGLSLPQQLDNCCNIHHQKTKWNVISADRSIIFVHAIGGSSKYVDAPASFLMDVSILSLHQHWHQVVFSSCSCTPYPLHHSGHCINQNHCPMLILFQSQHCLIQPTNPVSLKQILLHTKEWKIWTIIKKLLISAFHHLSSYTITWLNDKAKSYASWTREYVP